MLNIKNHIILDRVESWPVEVMDLINNSEKELKGYLLEERRLDMLGRTDLSIRFKRPYNIYSEKWNITIKKLDLVLDNYNIVGIHCTKLMDYEISDILDNGLRPLDKDFANQRVARLYKNGLISQELKKELQHEIVRT